MRVALKTVFYPRFHIRGIGMKEKELEQEIDLELSSLDGKTFMGILKKNAKDLTGSQLQGMRRKGGCCAQSCRCGR